MKLSGGSQSDYAIIMIMVIIFILFTVWMIVSIRKINENPNEKSLFYRIGRYSLVILFVLLIIIYGVLHFTGH
jgi:hypothetical protein